MTRTVALTGASGFLGRHLVRHFIAAGWRVRALVRRPDALAGEPGLEFVRGDIADSPALATLVADVQAVVHCAGLTKAKSAAEFHRVNALGTDMTLAAAAGATPRPRFIYVSSLAAREPHLSDYAASKRAGEETVALKGADIDWLIVRPPAIYGPGDPEILRLFRLLNWGLIPVPAPAAVERRLSLMYVDDVATAVTTMLTADLPRRRIFEIGDPAPGGHSWAAIAAAGERLLGKKVRPLPLSKPFMDFAARVNMAGCKLVGASPMMTTGKVNEIYHVDWVARDNPLTEWCSWRPSVALDEGFARTIAWYRERNDL